MSRFRLEVAACLLSMGMPWWSTTTYAQSPQSEDSASAQAIDVTPIRDLLHLINTIVEENPNCAMTIARFARLGGRAYLDSCAPYIRHNADNARIANEVDALLATPAYQLYFEQFGRYASPGAHRRVFFSLPYLAADAPGGIGANLLELCQHRPEVAAWYDSVVSRADLNRCLAISRAWLPPAEYSVPKTYFIYDGMGDAFALEGKVCFDLFGVILSKRLPATRFVGLSDIGADVIERVLAHEIHHVYSRGLIYAGKKSARGQDRWKDDLVRELVSEGTAMQCDPRQGLEREVRQDTAVMRYWIGALNGRLTDLEAGHLSEPEAKTWWDSTFEALPRSLLAGFLKQRFPGGNLDSLVACHMGERPDFAHTVGWWMVSRISDGGKHKDEVIRLLSNPDSLFNWYDAAVGAGDSTLLITVSAQ